MNNDTSLVHGFSANIAGGIKGLLSRLSGRKTRISPQAQERMRFRAEVKEQLVKLKEKGLSIPVFTL